MSTAIENPTTIPPVTFWDTYAEKIVTTAIYPGQGSITGLVYIGLGLAGETGEYCDQVKKVMRDDGGTLTEERRVRLCSELGDVLWYMGGGARELNVPISELLMVNSAQWVIRHLHGSGTTTGLALAAFRLQRAASLFTQQVDNVVDLGGIPDADAKSYLRMHLSAVYYTANLCAAQLRVDLRQLGADNVDKLFARRDRGTLGGDGEKR